MVPILEVADPDLQVDLNLSDKKLFTIWDKVQNGDRLSISEGVTLLETDDLPGVGRMADFAKKRVTGDKVYFVLNRHVNPTNICVLSCKFCDFAKKPGDEDAYEMSIEEILDHVDDDIHEIHIVGGHHPTWPFEYYVEMVKAIHDKAPHVQIKGFTASEIDYFQRRWKVSPEESLAILKEAGLKSSPHGFTRFFFPEKLMLIDGLRYTKPPTEWTFRQTARFYMGTLNRSKSGSIISIDCETFRMKPADSLPLYPSSIR